jgi:hypothetical protein
VRRRAANKQATFPPLPFYTAHNLELLSCSAFRSFVRACIRFQFSFNKKRHLKLELPPIAWLLRRHRRSTHATSSELSLPLPPLRPACLVLRV